MKYHGLVTLRIKDNYNRTYCELHNHNGGAVALQIAFANMLTGYDNNQMIPYYMSALDSNGIVQFSRTKITGLNKHKVAIAGIGETWCAVVNAIFPLQQGQDINDVASYIYKLYTKAGEELASVTFDPSSIAGNIDSGEGLQVNIEWQLYLGID